MRKVLGRIVSHPMTKIIFSLAIIISSVEGIYLEFREGFEGLKIHHGVMILGIMMFLENLLWILDIWAKKD